MARRPPRPHNPADGFNFRFVGPLALGATLNPLNSTMIATALVLIADDIGVPMTEISWLIAGLYIASAIAQPTMGKLADLFGPRRIYLFSLVIVALAGLVGQLANGLFGLVASRVLLGIGTSGAYPSAMRLFRERADLIGAHHRVRPWACCRWPRCPPPLSDRCWAAS
ncbi:MFS transporter [Sphingobium fuliginis]|uniref:MFS transporter n=1 Tax=Sphingobium fuliginis (strain ATCC 27551) TaxID=336203 RepID=UPI00069A9D06|nr:MFS transporter [Sphingobium fuliginis]